MHPIIYQYEIFGYDRFVAGYGLMLALGLVFGVGTVSLLARRRGLNILNVLIVALIAVGAGLIGSYVLFVITIIPEAIRNPSALLQGGLVFYGGPIAAIPAGYITAQRLGVPVLKMVDLAAPGLALGHALGRMGCFLGGCCFGGRWDGPLAVIFTNPLSPASHPPVPRHPTQLYEAGFLLLVSIATLVFFRRVRSDGIIGFSYLLAYAIFRFGIEIVRADSIRGYLIEGILTTSQTISILLVPIAIYGIWRLNRRNKSRTESPMAPVTNE